MQKLIPFKLTPQYREYVWGGNRIRPQAERTAEAWVVYEQNVIADGPMAGMTLAEASEKYGASLLGAYVVSQTGHKFPLLVKILDTAKWLSLQVHPNNEQAVRWEGAGHFGKMEGWYVIDADPGAQLISGFKPGVTSQQIQSSVGKKALLDLVGWKEVQAGDSLLIKPGILHALGPGLLIYEVQQTSDITYRVYDWDRPRKAGRKLHLEQAADVLDPSSDGKLNRTQEAFAGCKTLFASEFFKLDLIASPQSSIQCDTKGMSFQTITITDGSADVRGGGFNETLHRFETLVVPASAGIVEIAIENGTCLVAQVSADA